MSYQHKELNDLLELKPEFSDRDKIEKQDIPDFKRTQPEMYKRHWPEMCGK